MYERKLNNRSNWLFLITIPNITFYNHSLSQAINNSTQKCIHNSKLLVSLIKGGRERQRVILRKAGERWQGGRDGKRSKKT